MRIDRSIFEGKLICLRPIDHENDPQVESRWTHDLTWMRSLSRKIGIPQSVAQIKKKYKAIEKKVENLNEKSGFVYEGRVRIS